MGDKQFGRAITVIDGKPYEFMVSTVGLRSDSYDPLNRTPVAYLFDQTRPIGGAQNIEFTIKISSRMAHSYLKETSYENHATVIRFAFSSLKKEPSRTEFVFTSDAYELAKKASVQSGAQLRESILQFIYQVNDEWPTEKISFEDILENLNGSKELVSGWLRYYLEKGYLLEGGDKPLRAGGKTIAFRINPKRLKEIDEELRGSLTVSGELKVFLSYSHLDKYIAGEVKREFEEYGFEAFVAHDDIELSREWEDRILEELLACHVFIPILTENFRNSPWTDQEAGHALAGNKVIIPLRVTIDPYGFIGRFQGEKLHKERVIDSCRKIVEVLSTRSELTGFFTEGSKAVRKLKGSLQGA